LLKRNIVSISSLLLAAVILFFIYIEKFPQKIQPVEKKGLSVSVLVLEPQTTSFNYQLPGRISPYRQSQVRPQIDGIITARLFKQGARIKKGDQLYQIDDAQYRAALNSAIADLKGAEANGKAVEAKTKRYEFLIKINAVSQQEYDDVKAQFDQAKAAIDIAKAAVDLAQVKLDYTKVYAPISGQISRSLVTEGTLVTSNQEQNLATITQLDPIYIDMQQSGTDALYLRSRMIRKKTIPVKLSIEQDSEVTYPQEGVLKFSEVTVDESTGSIVLRAVIPNPDSILLPGLFVRASIDLGSEKVILVPQRAAVRTPEGSLMVWIVDEKKQAQIRPIKIEQAYQDNWIVADGLKQGDQVIVEGYIKTTPGTLVSPIPWNK